MTELDGIVKRQADEAVDRVQTLAKIAQIEAALCSFIEKKSVRGEHGRECESHSKGRRVLFRAVE